MSHRYTKSCDQCGNSFTTDRKETRSCSKSCAAFMAKPLPWLECSKCMAVIGLGLKSAAKLIGIVSFSSIGSAWSVRGIKRTVPAEGSWDLYARRRRLVGQPIGLNSREFGELWMSEYNPRFPDWSSIWTKEKNRRKMRERYESWTSEEKKEWNKACLERRNSDPAQLQKQRERSKKWRLANPDRVAVNHRLWSSENRDKVRASAKRARTNPKNKAKLNLRDRFKEIMKSAKNGGTESFRQMVGCSTLHLQSHLESKFKRGMTWENYGTHWHVDHIIPCAAFDHTKQEQVRQCWHFTNLRPLEAKKNMAKGAKIEAPQLSLLLTA